MREFRFRAWDEQKKVMHYDFEFIRSGIEGNDWILFKSDRQTLEQGQVLDNPYFAQQLKIMQFTGLVDKQGKEIFEGDIVDVGVSNILSGERYLCFVDYIPANFIFRNLNKSLSTVSPLLSFNNSTMFKIVGNIYSNPELLKEVFK